LDGIKPDSIGLQPTDNKYLFLVEMGTSKIRPVMVVWSCEYKKRPQFGDVFIAPFAPVLSSLEQRGKDPTAREVLTARSPCFLQHHPPHPPGR
jgi:hypothetical protein